MHDYNGGRKQATTNVFFSLNLSAVPKKSTPGKFACNWHFQRTGINATKSDKTRNHFSSDIPLLSPTFMLKPPGINSPLLLIKPLRGEDNYGFDNLAVWGSKASIFLNSKNGGGARRKAGRVVDKTVIGILSMDCLLELPTWTTLKWTSHWSLVIRVRKLKESGFI